MTKKIFTLDDVLAALDAAVADRGPDWI